MPERPDLEYVVPRLVDALVGKRITGVGNNDPVVLRLAVPGELSGLLTGRTFTGVVRHLQAVRLFLEPDDLEIVVVPMLAGRFRLEPASKKAQRRDCVWWELEDGQALRYHDAKRMGKVYVIRAGDLAKVPKHDKPGIDVLSPEFTVARLRAMAKKRRDQVRVFLMDKSALDAFGNAYADEVLFAAGLHPKLRANQLTEDEVTRLHAAMQQVLRDALAEIERQAPPLDAKVRDFLSVRLREGPCPQCGATLRKAGVRGYDSYFCPECQPDRTARGFVDWRKTR